MKRILLWTICIILLLTGCSSNVLLKDDFEATVLTEEIAEYIVLSYNSTLPVADSFTEGEKIPYEKAFLYFSYGGFFMQNGQLREKLTPYLEKDTYHLPARMVDTYLSSKFNTQVEHSAISVYDEQTQTYTIRPTEAYVGKIIIDSVTALGNDEYQITATIVDELSLRLLLQTFRVKYDGDYHFVSFLQKDATKDVSAKEQLLISFVEDYYQFNPNLTFDSKNKLKYDQVFPYFSMFGFWDQNGDLSKDLKAYATGRLYDPYQIPASIVDAYLLSKFDVAVDHSLIDCYDAYKNCYTIKPQVSDWYNITQLVDYEKSDDIYTVTVKTFIFSDSKYVQRKFCLQITDNGCKYLSVTN